MKSLIFATFAVLALFAAPSFADEADIERGAKVFTKCKSCHRIGEDARNATGPHLNGLFGRKAGSLDGFRYSPDMVRMGNDGLVWDHEKLDLFIGNPKTLVSRTRMAFRGIESAEDRAALLAFLRIYSDDPQNIPESAPTAIADPIPSAEVLALQGDPDYGEYLSGECVTCHRADGGEDGIPSIVGWDEADFVVALHAYRSKHRENEAMQLVASRLSDDEIAGLAAYFGALE